jgi:hypothetical protein
MDGKLYPKTILKVYPISISYQITEFILLAGIGALGVLIHAYLRIPMKLPGHHGVIYMALLMSGRLISKKSYASSLSSIGAAAMLLVPLGFKDPFIPIIYLFPGYIVDILFYQFKKLQPKIIFPAIICGLAYMIIPLIRIVIAMITGFHYGSLMGGFLYPVFTHFIFGFTGGFIVSGVYSIYRKRPNNNE